VDYVQFIYTNADKHPDIFETLPLPIAAYGRDGVVAGANRIFRELVDITEDDIRLGKVNIHDCLNDNDAALTEAAHNAFDGSEKVYQNVGRALHTKSNFTDGLLSKFPNAIFFPMTFDREGVKLGAVLLDHKEDNSEEEADEPVKKKKPVSRFRYLAAACFMVAVIGIGVFVANIDSPGNDYIFLPEENVPLAAPLFPDANAKPYTGGERGIAIPGIEDITIVADTADVQIILFNPADNDSDFMFEIIVDGETRYTSGLVKPGMCIEGITLSKVLPEGEHKAELKIRALAPGQYIGMNGATVEFNIIAERRGAE